MDSPPKLNSYVLLRRKPPKDPILCTVTSHDHRGMGGYYVRQVQSLPSSKTPPLCYHSRTIKVLGLSVHPHPPPLGAPVRIRLPDDDKLLDAHVIRHIHTSDFTIATKDGLEFDSNVIAEHDIHLEFVSPQTDEKPSNQQVTEAKQDPPKIVPKGPCTNSKDTNDPSPSSSDVKHVESLHCSCKNSLANENLQGKPVDAPNNCIVKKENASLHRDSQLSNPQLEIIIIEDSPPSSPRLPVVPAKSPRLPVVPAKSPRLPVVPAKSPRSPLFPVKPPGGRNIKLENLTQMSILTPTPSPPDNLANHVQNINKNPTQDIQSKDIGNTSNQKTSEKPEEKGKQSITKHRDKPTLENHNKKPNRKSSNFSNRRTSRLPRARKMSASVPKRWKNMENKPNANLDKNSEEESSTSNAQTHKNSGALRIPAVDYHSGNEQSDLAVKNKGNDEGRQKVVRRRSSMSSPKRATKRRRLGKSSTSRSDQESLDRKSGSKARKGRNAIGDMCLEKLEAAAEAADARYKREQLRRRRYNGKRKGKSGTGNQCQGDDSDIWYDSEKEEAVECDDSDDSSKSSSDDDQDDDDDEDYDNNGGSGYGGGKGNRDESGFDDSDADRYDTTPESRKSFSLRQVQDSSRPIYPHESYSHVMQMQVGNCDDEKGNSVVPKTEKEVRNMFKSKATPEFPNMSVPVQLRICGRRRFPARPSVLQDRLMNSDANNENRMTPIMPCGKNSGGSDRIALVTSASQIK